MKITNNSQALQGVHTVKGVVYLNPKETRDLEMSDAEAKRAARLPFLGIEGVDRGNAMQIAPTTPLADNPNFAILDKGRGWFVIAADGIEVTKSLRKDDVDGFDEFSEADKAAFVEANKADD